MSNETSSSSDHITGMVRDDVVILKTQFNSLAGRFSQLEAQISAFMNSQRDAQKPNYMVILGFLSFGVMLIGGSWALVGLKTDNTVGPVNAALQVLARDVEANKETASRNSSQLQIVSAQNATSIADRSDTNRAVSEMKAALAAEISDSRAYQAGTAAKLTEIETQFAAADEIRNIQFANQLRWNALNWDKSHPGEKYPDAIEYYPKVSQHSR